MERRLILALTLSLLVMLGYPYLLQQIYGKASQPPAQPRKEERAPLSTRKEAASPSPLPQHPHQTSSFKTEGTTLLIDEESASIAKIVLTDRFGSSQKEASFVDVGKIEDNLGYMWIKNPKVGPILWSKVEQNTQKILFSGEAGGFKFQKGFFLGKTDFDLTVEIGVTNTTAQTLPLYFGLVGPSSLIPTKEDARFFDLLAFSGGKVRRYHVQRVRRSPVDQREQSASWLAIQSKYFSLITKTEAPSSGYFVRSAGGEEAFCLGFWSQPQEVGPDQTVQQSFVFYAGPTSLSELSKLGRWAEGTMNLGWLGGIAKFLLKGLIWLKQLTGSYGIAIMLMTFCITLLFLPLSVKSYKSMSKMKLLQPEMTKLRELYKDKPQKLNKEVMELYRRHKVNPLGGCLPLLFQMPIFIAFYQVLMRSIELKGTPFLLIRDLSAPDRVIPLPFSIWPLGEAINLLPLLMVGAMFLQQKLSGAVTAPGPEAEAQMTMTKIMPALFGFIFYGLPSGLVLYWLTNTLLSIGTQRLFSQS